MKKKLAQDKTALNKVQMSHSGSYTLTHGLGAAIKDELSTKLREVPFSLNMDEATNNAMDKIVNIVVQFYDCDRQEVVVQHLASAKVNIATVENNAAAIVNALQERGLPMSNRVFEN